MLMTLDEENPTHSLSVPDALHADVGSAGSAAPPPHRRTNLHEGRYARRMPASARQPPRGPPPRMQRQGVHHHTLFPTTACRQPTPGRLRAGALHALRGTYPTYLPTTAHIVPPLHPPRIHRVAAQHVHTACHGASCAALHKLTPSRSFKTSLDF